MQPYALLRPQGHSVSAPHAVPASAPHVVQARLPWAPCSRSVSVLKALRCRRAHPRSADGQAQVQPRANLVSLHATRSCIQRNETPKRRLRLRGRPPLPPGQEPCLVASRTRARQTAKHPPSRAPTPSHPMRSDLPYSETRRPRDAAGLQSPTPGTRRRRRKRPQRPSQPETHPGMRNGRRLTPPFPPRNRATMA